MTSPAEERSIAVRKRNADNRRRAAVMERRIAKYLQGSRIPMSGAGALKGDGIVYSKIGMYLVECKLSALFSKGYSVPSMRFEYRWLSKLEKDVKSMRAKFGILVFHYHKTRPDYVIMRRDWFYHLGDDTDLIDAFVFTSDRSGYNLRIDLLDKWLQQKPGPRSVMLWQTPVGEYVVMHLDTFKELLDAI